MAIAMKLKLGLLCVLITACGRESLVVPVVPVLPAVPRIPLSPLNFGTVSVRLTSPIPDTVRGLSLYVDVATSGGKGKTDLFWSLDGTAAVGTVHAEFGPNYTAKSDSTWTVFVAQNLKPGTHRFVVVAIDSARYVDSLVSIFVVKIDTARYRAQVLQTLGGLLAEPHDINASGFVAGMAQDAAGVAHPVVWSGGQVHALPDNGVGVAYGLNDKGAVVGLAQDGRVSRSCIRGVIWRYWGAVELLPNYPLPSVPDTSDACQSLDDPSLYGGLRNVEYVCFYFGCPGGASWPRLINERGTILTRAFRDKAGEVTRIGGPYMSRWVMNNVDRVAFTEQDRTVPLYEAHGTIFGVGAVPTPPAGCHSFNRVYSYVNAIDDRSNVAGTVARCDVRAFIANAKGEVTDLSSLTGGLGAISLDNAGDVLFAGNYGGNMGFQEVRDEALAPHVLRGGRLAAIAVEQRGWTTVRVMKMNDSGIIMGTATGPDGLKHAVILTPSAP